MPGGNLISRIFAKRRNLCWLLVLVPPAITAVLIDNYRWKVPQLDDFSFVRYHEAVTEGTATIEETLSAHNEHRVVFHRLFYTLVFHLADGDVRVFPVITFCIVFAIFGCVAWLALPLLRERPRGGWFLLLLAALTLFSAAQVYTWQWGFIYANHLPWFALAISMVLLRSKRSPTWLAFAGSGTLTSMATLSNASTFPVWFLLPAFAFLVGRLPLGNRRSTLVCLVSWFAVCVAVNAFAFSGMAEKVAGNDADPHGIRLALSDPLHAIAFVLSLGGSQFGHGTEFEFPELSTAVGAVLLALFAIACLYVWRHRSDRAFVARCAPWIVFSLGSWMSASLIAAGRLTPSAILAEAGHYVLTCMYTVVGLVFLLPAAAAHARENARSRWQWIGGPAARTGLACLATAAVVLHVVNWRWGVHEIKWWFADYLQQEATVMFADTLPNADLGKLRRFGGVETFRYLRRRGMIDHIPALPDAKLSNLRSLSPLSRTWAAFEKLKALPDGGHEASGFAHLKGWVRPADVVILTWSREDEAEETIFQITHPQVPRDYFQRIHRTKEFREHYARWSVRLGSGLLPDGMVVVRAHALHWENRRIRQIAGEWVVEGGAVTPIDGKD